MSYAQYTTVYTNPLLQVNQYTILNHRITRTQSQMTGLLMSDDELKGFTESLKILETTLDLAALVSPP